MRARRVVLCAPAALLLVTTAVAAGGPDRRPIVARVFRTPIHRVVFDHWMNVAARSETLAHIPPAGSARWNDLRDQVMQFLISGQWIEGEARLRGIVISPAHVLRVFRRTRHEAFPTPAAWKRFLARSGMTQIDVMYRIKLDALSNVLRRRVLHGVHGAAAQQRALDDYVTSFQRRWRAKTACLRLYAVADCGTVVGG